MVQVSKPDPDVPAPPRFLPAFDNALLDGFACGTWKVERAAGKATLEIEPFEPLSEGDRDTLAEEGVRLLAFIAPEAGATEVRFVGSS